MVDLIILFSVPASAFAATLFLSYVVSRLGWLSDNLRNDLDESKNTEAMPSEHVESVKIRKNPVSLTAYKSVRRPPKFILMTSKDLDVFAERMEKSKDLAPPLEAALSRYFASYHAQSRDFVKRAVAEGIAEGLAHIRQEYFKHESVPLFEFEEEKEARAKPH